MNRDFHAYLKSKFALDSRSLNRDVLAAMLRALSGHRRIRCLDLGSGHGATARRLIEYFPETPLEIIGLDIDAGLLNAGRIELSAELRTRGFEIEDSGFEIIARRAEQLIRLRFDCVSALDWQPARADTRFDLITAHAFLDIVPIQPLLKKSLQLLRPGGFFYTTLNYDGQTALIPIYENEQFERQMLECYELSMEHRRIGGTPTGGAYSGRRLVGALCDIGFEIHCYGSSDWNITPVNRRYRDLDASCLKSLLTTIHDEVSRNPAFVRNELDTWLANRFCAVDLGTLGLIAHQMDVLAVKPPRMAVSRL